MEGQHSKEQTFKGERAKARWSILRNAVLQKSQNSNASQHSIHRFPGHQFLKRQLADMGSVLGQINRIKWKEPSLGDTNLRQLSLACLAKAAASPQGGCIEIFCDTERDVRNQVENVKVICGPSISITMVPNQFPISLQVTSKSMSTQYAIFEYVIDDQFKIWTREPREHRLSIEDLVSHRKTGVDNTGNVCVWDSERTLAYLLYHHLPSFALTKTPLKILELGTGMAGLSALALGERIAKEEKTERRVDITLTDGHPDGVLNNQVNLFLTQMCFNSDPCHPFLSLNVAAQVLVWTEDIETDLPPQDLVLVSDCLHFQNFHAALLITTLRSLRVGGTAIFCQPPRSDSMSNFMNMLAFVPDLATHQWWTHPELEDRNRFAKEKYEGVYEENLHHPRIFLLHKERALTEADSKRLADHQAARIKENRGG